MISNLVLAVLLMSSIAIQENSPADGLRCDLLEHGFDNVFVVLENGHLIVSYENRAYRSETKAIFEILTVVSCTWSALDFSAVNFW